MAATMNGAAALNFKNDLGCLRRGYWADMAVLELPPSLGSRQLLIQMLEGAGECIATVVQGKVAWSKHDSAVPAESSNDPHTGMNGKS